MANRIQNKIAIVTGGALGIGRATCELFAAEGARVVVADVAAEAGEATAAAIRAGGGEAVFVRCDVAHEDDIRYLVAATVAQFGGVDMLVNHAAAFVLKGLEATVEDWQRSLSVYVVGTALTSRYAAEEMKRRGGGAIVNLGSISGFIAQPHFVAYSATKAAIIQMTRNMALDLAPFNIRVNCVCPGTILTSASERHCAQLGISLAEFMAEAGPQHMLNRVGQPREVANAILFLASDEASFITATHLMVDGGLTAQ